MTVTTWGSSQSNEADRANVKFDESDGPVDVRMRVGVVEDHDLLATLLQGWLEQLGYEVLRAEGGDAGRLAEAVVAASPDVALVDYWLGGVCNGIPVVAAASEQGIPVIVLTASTDPLVHAACLEAGAVGILQKGAKPRVIADALDAAVAGEALIAPHDRRRMLAQLEAARREQHRRTAPFSQLTRREEEVLALICEGLSAAEIAERSFVALSTVRSQIRSVLMKLGVSSQLAAAAAARRAGWEPAAHAASD